MATPQPQRRPGAYVEDIERIDPDFARLLTAGRDDMLKPSALAPKIKWLLLLALDMAFLTPGGTKGMADQARRAGATAAEIADVLKQAFVTAGAQRLGTYMNGHREQAPDPAAPLQNSGAWYQPLEAEAPEFANLLKQLRDQLWAPSALDTKTKCFISMVLDMRAGLAHGARVMAVEARRAGASEAELVDVVKVAYVNGGAQRVVVGVNAFT